MSEETSAHHTKNEIIIVKRRSDEGHDEHHGGVWKIAYADFMTAMMAFFLVMWLINASNEKTRTIIASYFNPIKLVDERPTDRGIRDAGNAEKGEVKQPLSKTEGSKPSSGDGAETGHEQNATAGEQTKYSEADYFENPFSVLAEIAQESGQKANVSSAGEGGAQTSGPATGASGGKAYRDPFDPDFWTQQVQTVDGEPASEKDVAAPLPGAVGSPAQKVAAADPKTDATKPDAKADAGKAGEPANAASAGKAAAEASPAKPEKAKPDAAKVSEAAKIRSEIAAATGGSIGPLADAIAVKPVKGGILVRVTDRLDDGMFNVGSAVPRRDMVVAMEKIGKVLSGRKGTVVIRGHTDARPFKGKSYDNWRLSTARAESAYYMLVRGGLDKDRVEQIAGFADRELLLPDRPFDDANRRIEIFLRTDGPAG